MLNTDGISEHLALWKEWRKKKFWSKGKRTDRGCLEWIGPRDHPTKYNPRQYPYGNVRVGSKTKNCYPSRKAHRVAWVLTHGPIPDGLHVLHTCDNPPCYEPAHLYLGTQKDNMRDMRDRGRKRRGNGRTLPQEVLIYAKQLRLEGLGRREIKEYLKIGKKTIVSLFRGDLDWQITDSKWKGAVPGVLGPNRRRI